MLDALRRKPIAFIAKLLLFGIVMVFVIRALVRRLCEIDLSAVSVHWIWVLAGFGCIAAANVLHVLFYQQLLRMFRHGIGWRYAAVLAWVTPLGRYLPGKVATIAGAVWILRRSKVPMAVSTVVVLLLHAIGAGTGLIVALPLLRLAGLPAGTRWLMAAGVAAVVVGFLSLHPKIAGRLLNRFLVRLGKTPMAHFPSLHHYVAPTVTALLQWGLFGLGLYCLARSLGDVSIAWYPQFAGAMALAMVLGLLAVFAPSGIGVREGVILVVLSPIVGKNDAALLSVGLRIVQTLVELTLAAVGLAVLLAIRRAGSDTRPCDDKNCESLPAGKDSRS